MSKTTNDYTVSVHYDSRLYQHDIDGSIAHVSMLAQQKIISAEDSRSIIDGLNSIRKEIDNGKFPWKNELEDVHMNIENRLFTKIGNTAGKLHTARSRNDQISLDMRLYAKDVGTAIIISIRTLQKTLVDKADCNSNVIMPGYTHLQRGQPILLAHHLLAYYEMFDRDSTRFQQAYHAADVMPLGSGALAGVPYPVDRNFVANQLGFSKVTSNSIDAVSDRDFILDFHTAASTCMVHLSRLAEELIIWSSEEFGFIRLADEFTTGSSMMPQKRNPDFAELARGKTGRVFGNLMATLSILKGLPLSYNRDLQEDKERFFDTVDTISDTLKVFSEMLTSAEICVERMRQSTEKGYLLATDIADYLVAKGVPFREAHGIVSKISIYAEKEHTKFSEIPLEIYRKFSNQFDEDVLSITVESSVSARDVSGGTAPNQVQIAIESAKTYLEENSVS